MTRTHNSILLDESINLDFSEFCALCQVKDDLVHEMIHEGMLVPEGSSQKNWRFNGLAVKRIHVTLRLQNDLGINLPGVALALNLLEELEELRSQLNKIPPHHP